MRAKLGGIQNAKDKQILIDCFEYVLGNLRMGVPEHQTRAENFQSYFQESTTGTSTGEFSVQHGLPTAPRLAIPVLDLNQPGSQLVPLEVSRSADARRIYLKTSAGSTNARFTVLVE